MADSETTRFVADIWCMHCTRRVGSWEWQASQAQQDGRFVPSEGADVPTVLRRPRCFVCGGPVYLDEVQEIRVFPRIDWSPAKRGRKPKQREAIA
jgi:hypothetical protein